MFYAQNYLLKIIQVNSIHDRFVIKCHAAMHNFCKNILLFRKEVNHESPKMQKSYTVTEALKSIDFYILSLIVFCDIIPVVLFTSTYKVSIFAYHWEHFLTAMLYAYLRIVLCAFKFNFMSWFRCSVSASILMTNSFPSLLLWALDSIAEAELSGDFWWIISLQRYF